MTSPPFVPSPPTLNRLQWSKSPYLLQHATNPVDWYEWGDEAFERAVKEKKPVFLSVGYSACHWCHVLAHESFEDPEIAKYLNENFISVKVDREERPDVDRVYMTFIQATVGRGGWPMSVFLTPSLHPFFGGTYFPKPAFLNLLHRIAEVWKEEPARLQASGEGIMAQLREISNAKSSKGLKDSDVDVEVLSQKIFNSLEESFDEEYGGFGGAPKFPSPAQTFTPLLRHAYYAAGDDAEGAAEALKMTTQTLLAIDAGGIHDHVGGGFSRYSVDEKWHVPHFEKMLYDQAQLLTSALSASLLHPLDSPTRLTLQTMGADIILYVSTSLTSPSTSAFFSAEDADSLPNLSSHTKVEGAFYVWEYEELEKVLGDDHTVSLFAKHFGVEVSGNVDPSHDIQGELVGKNVLARQFTIEETAKETGIPVGEVQEVLTASLAKLKAYREEHRPRPHLDDKVVTSWNGLLLSALALAHTSLAPSFALRDETLEMANGIVAFLHENIWDSSTRELRRSWREGPGPRGMSDDYACMIQGLLDLYEATGTTPHLLFALTLQERQIELFHDPAHGGFFCSPADDPHLLVRLKDVQDGAEPSASGVTLSNLLRLGAVFDNRREGYGEIAEGIVESSGEMLVRGGQALGTTVAGMWLLDKGFKQLILTGASEDPSTQALRAVLDERFIPNRLLIHIEPSNPPMDLAWRNEVVKAVVEGLGKEGGRASVRVCEAGVCGLPIFDPAELVKELL